MEINQSAFSDAINRHLQKLKRHICTDALCKTAQTENFFRLQSLTHFRDEGIIKTQLQKFIAPIQFLCLSFYSLHNTMHSHSITTIYQVQRCNTTDFFPFTSIFFFRMRKTEKKRKREKEKKKYITSDIWYGVCAICSLSFHFFTTLTYLL